MSYRPCGRTPLGVDLGEIDIRRGDLATGRNLLRTLGATGLTSASTTAAVDRLEAKGYVRRERDPHDRRKVFFRENAPARQLRGRGNGLRTTRKDHGQGPTMRDLAEAMG